MLEELLFRGLKWLGSGNSPSGSVSSALAELGFLTDWTLWPLEQAAHQWVRNRQLSIFLSVVEIHITFITRYFTCHGWNLDSMFTWRDYFQHPIHWPPSHVLLSAAMHILLRSAGTKTLHVPRQCSWVTSSRGRLLAKLWLSWKYLSGLCEKQEAG